MASTLEVSYPPFKLGGSRFDQSTFFGRFRHFLDVIDPTTLFTTEQKLQNSIKLLEDFKNGNLDSSITNRQLWDAQKIKQAIIHPDTGEKIFMPFRMSGFVPFGSPIVVGLLLPNPSLAHIVFWQWLNQSHNACVNYANRNASKPSDTTTFIKGYLGATTSAISIAVGLTVLLNKSDKLFSPKTKLLIHRFIPFPAVAAASTLNVLLMRIHETNQGIEVLDKNGQTIGTSKIAAKKALTETAITRFFLPAPILVIPPAILTQLEKTAWLKSHPRWHLPINAALVTLSFGLALPIAISLFPQMSEVKRDDLEPEIQTSTQEPILFYNKGL